MTVGRDDRGGAGARDDAPINPYNLLEAVNDSSDTAHMGWLIFLGIMSYLMIAVAGVTHKSLLLETPVALPILQVSIDQSLFFQFAPVLLVLFHLGVVSQLVLLARKTIEFDTAVRTLEPSLRRSHPLRLELHNFFFVQAIAGPHRSRIMSVFLHAMSWLTIVVLPVVLLLYIQIKFLPYHDPEVTWTHRVALFADMAMLVLIGIFLTRIEPSFPQAFVRSGAQYPLRFVVTALVFILVAFFSLFVATIPGEQLDRIGERIAGAAVRGASEARPSRQAGGFAMPVIVRRSDGALFGLFHRNLIVTDTDLARAPASGEGEASLNLRGRDLRYARLERSDLRRADLTGADLSGASLAGADLREARLGCADLNELLLSEDRAAARCASLRGASLGRARLGGARMAGADLTEARLEEANLEGVELAYAVLIGANLSGAHLERADLTGGVQMQGANLLVAVMQGADLTGAQAQFADFSSAGMQGAVLAHAELQGAVLRDADLEGADLARAQLQGADLSGTRLLAADLRSAAVWMTLPPPAAGLALADLTSLQLQAPDVREVERLQQRIARIADPRLARQAQDALGPVLVPAESRRWGQSGEHQRWTGFARESAAAAAGDAYRGELTEHLARLACKTRWSAGFVAAGVARRAMGQEFRGRLSELYERLKAKDCPAGDTVPRRVLQSLSTAVDIARGN
jgi:uncharacterized protein YjbI with pentapeptide repeats